MSLKSTFPARFGSFSYQFYSTCAYRFYNAVSVEDSNSQPLEQGLRGLFIQDLSSGRMDGWVLTAAKSSSDWEFKGVSVDPFDFNPEEAPDLSL